MTFREEGKVFGKTFFYIECETFLPTFSSLKHFKSGYLRKSGTMGKCVHMGVSQILSYFGDLTCLVKYSQKSVLKILTCPLPDMT